MFGPLRRVVVSVGLIGPEGRRAFRVACRPSIHPDPGKGNQMSEYVPGVTVSPHKAAFSAANEQVAHASSLIRSGILEVPALQAAKVAEIRVALQAALDALAGVQ